MLRITDPSRMVQETVGFSKEQGHVSSMFVNPLMHNVPKWSDTL